MAVLPNSFRRFDHFLALTVPSAVGLVTHVPLRLYPDEKSSLQRTATQRHRTQIVFNFPNFGLFISQSNILCEKTLEMTV